MEQKLYPLAQPGCMEQETIDFLQANPGQISLLEALLHHLRIRIIKLGGNPDQTIAEEG